jgi:uncharacterized protein YlxW (UPF0749 family)
MHRLAHTWSIVFVCFILGVLLVLQLRSTGRAATSTISTSDQARVLGMLVESNADLRDEIAGLEAQLARLDPANREERNAALRIELGRLVVVSGDSVAVGPGVRVDVSGQINPLDMQDLINEMRNAGAEAIALNGQRVTVRSVVARAGDDLALDHVRLSAPYTLEAIAQPDIMEKALLRHGGLVSLLEYAYPGLKIKVSVSDGLVLPARREKESFRFAQPAP